MTSRRILQFLLVAVLVLAPFGRIGLGAADAMGTGGHCGGMAMSHQGKAQPAAVDCAIACAAIAPTPEVAEFNPPPAPRAAHAPLPQPLRAGLSTGADPPPPRAA